MMLQDDRAVDAEPDNKARPDDVAGAEPVARWAAVGAVALGVFAFVTTEFLPVGILPQIAVELRIPLARAGLMLTAPGLVAAIFAPAVLLFAGDVDRRRLLIVLTTLLLVADLVCACAPNFPILLFGRGLLGAGLGGFWSIALAVGARLVPPGRLARAISIIVAGITMATIVGLPTGSLIGNWLGWRTSFAAAAFLAAVATVGLIVLLPSLVAQQRVRPADFGLLLASRRCRSALALVLCLFGGNLAAYTYLAPYLRSLPGLGGASIPAVLLLFGITSFLANILMPGPLARHPRLTVAAQAIAMAVALLGFTLPFVALPVTAFLLVIWAVPFGAVPLCLNHWVQDAAVEAPEAGSALYVSTVQVAIALGSAGGALVVGLFGMPANFWLGGLLSFAGVAAIVWPGRPAAKTPAPSIFSSAASD